MSALGKVFTILVFLASCVTLGVNSTLYLKRENYREGYEQIKKAYQKLSTEDTKVILALREQVDDKQDQLSANLAAVSSQKLALEALASRFEDRTRELAQRTAEFGVLLDSHKTIAERMKDKDTQIRSLSDELKTAKSDRDEAFSDRKTAEDQLAVLMAQRAGLEEEKSNLKKNMAVLQEDLYAAESSLEYLREKYDISTLLVGTPPPPIDAKVVYVSYETDPPLCSLGVGDNDNVKPGYTFVIYRGNEFIGQALVEKVLSDISHCRVLFTKEGQKVKMGDNATTR